MSYMYKKKKKKKKKKKLGSNHYTAQVYKKGDGTLTCYSA